MRENAKLKEVNESLKEQFKTTKFVSVDKKSLDQFTRKLLKDYQSGADTDKIRSSLDTLYGYIANGEDGHAPGWDTAYRMAYDTAVQVLEFQSTHPARGGTEFSDFTLADYAAFQSTHPARGGTPAGRSSD